MDFTSPHQVQVGHSSKELTCLAQFLGEGLGELSERSLCGLMRAGRFGEGRPPSAEAQVEDVVGWLSMAWLLPHQANGLPAAQQASYDIGPCSAKPL